MPRSGAGAASPRSGAGATSSRSGAGAGAGGRGGLTPLLGYGFAAGIIAFLVFHEGTAFLLHHEARRVPGLLRWLGSTPAPFSMRPSLYGFPALPWLALWYGLWGAALAALLRRTALPDLLAGCLAGAVVVSLAGFLLARQLRGLPLPVGSGQGFWLRQILLNGAWGWGSVVVVRLFAGRS